MSDALDRSPASSARRWRIGLVTATSVRNGAGTDNWILNLVRSNPYPDVAFTVFESRWIDRERMDPADYAELRAKARFVVLPDHWRLRRRTLAALAWVRPKAARFFLRELLQRAIVRGTVGLRRAWRTAGSEVDVLYFIDNLSAEAVDPTIRVPLVGSSHNLSPTEGPASPTARRLVFRWLFRRFQAMHYLAEPLRLRTGFERPGDFVIPPGIPAGRFRPAAPVSTECRRFLYLAHLEAGKGIFDLLDAWEGANVPEATLTVAGTGSAEPSVRRRAAALPRVRVLGAVPSNDVPSVYAAHDVLVFPTRFDTFPVVVLEALASGLRVRTSPVLRGIFDRFEASGHLRYDAGGIAATRRAIEEAYRSPALTEAERRELNARVEAEYAWNVVAPRMIDALRRLVRTDSAPP